MKRYTLEAQLFGKTVKFDESFKTRNSALDYIFDYLEDNYIFNTQVTEDYEVNDNKHDIRYITNNGCDFRITRVIF